MAFLFYDAKYIIFVALRGKFMRCRIYGPNEIAAGGPCLTVMQAGDINLLHDNDSFGAAVVWP